MMQHTHLPVEVVGVAKKEIVINLIWPKDIKLFHIFADMFSKMFPRRQIRKAS